MSAWLSLTKKELRLGMPVFWFALIAYLILVGIAASFGQRQGYGWEGLGIVSFLAIFGSVFYLPYYLLYSLLAERKKLHLWLHNPLSSQSLLLAKLVAGTLSMIVSVVIFSGGLLASLGFSTHVVLPLPWSKVVEVALFGGLHLFLGAFSFGIWFIFFWIIFLLCTRFSGTFLSCILTFVLFIAAVSILSWFSSTPAYELLTGWGEIQLTEMIQGLNFPFNLDEVENVLVDSNSLTIYLGSYVYEVVLTLLLFFGAAWLLEHKVEV